MTRRDLTLELDSTSWTSSDTPPPAHSGITRFIKTTEPSVGEEIVGPIILQSKDKLILRWMPGAGLTQDWGLEGLEVTQVMMRSVDTIVKTKETRAADVDTEKTTTTSTTSRATTAFQTVESMLSGILESGTTYTPPTISHMHTSTGFTLEASRNSITMTVKELAHSGQATSVTYVVKFTLWLSKTEGSTTTYWYIDPEVDIEVPCE